MNYGVFYSDNYADLPIYLNGADERGLKYDHLYRHGVAGLIGCLTAVAPILTTLPKHIVKILRGG